MGTNLIGHEKKQWCELDTSRCHKTHFPSKMNLKIRFQIWNLHKSSVPVATRVLQELARIVAQIGDVERLLSSCYLSLVVCSAIMV